MLLTPFLRIFLAFELSEGSLSLRKAVDSLRKTILMFNLMWLVKTRNKVNAMSVKFIVNLFFSIYLWCVYVSVYTCVYVCVHAYTHAHFYDGQKTICGTFFFPSCHVVLKISLLTLDSKMPVYLPSNTIGPNLNLKAGL